MNREVIRIEEPQEGIKPVEFTQRLSAGGWQASTISMDRFEKVVYLGNCNLDGDMFAAWITGTIYIFKGHLNSGRY